MHLSNALKENSTLHTCNLSCTLTLRTNVHSRCEEIAPLTFNNVDCQLDDDAVQHLVLGLKDNTTLREIYLSGKGNSCVSCTLAVFVFRRTHHNFVGIRFVGNRQRIRRGRHASFG